MHAIIEINLYKFPWNLFWNGNFAVCIFFVLSGFVLSNKYFKTRNLKIVLSGAFRRYPRLLIPVVVSVFIGYLLVKFNLFWNTNQISLTKTPPVVQRFWSETGDLFYALKQGFFSIFVKKFDYPEHFNPVLWTMYYEFLGSFIVFAVIGVLRNKHIRYISYLILIIFFRDSYLLAFILGLIISEFYNCSTFANVAKYKYVGIASLVMGIVMGVFSYPTQDASTILYTLESS